MVPNNAMRLCETFNGTFVVTDSYYLFFKSISRSSPSREKESNLRVKSLTTFCYHLKHLRVYLFL